MDSLIDPTIHEVVHRKCTRASGTEGALTFTRYCVVHEPQPMLYMTNDISNARIAAKERIKRGMELSPELIAAYARAEDTEFTITFSDMDLRVSWARNKGTYKQSGYQLVICDEASMWQSFAADMIRRRADMYRFHHILFLSSPDPTKKGDPDRDPIILLYEDTDRRKWFMPDPGKKRRKFYFVLSGGEGKKRYGVIWPESAKHGDEWDLDQVRAEAYYLTEHGTKITEDMRMDLVRAGEWQPTAKAKRDDVRGYWTVGPMIPVDAGNFGELAARFLAAKYHLTDTGTKEERLHNSLRVYMAESWAEAHRETNVVARDDSLDDREATYSLGEVYVPDGCGHGIILTLDVQKYHIWWLARVWSRNPQEDFACCAALLDFGTKATFADIYGLIDDINPAWVGFDIGYNERRNEVRDFCAEFTPQGSVDQSNVVAMRGEDKDKMTVPIYPKIEDALEGRASHGGSNKYLALQWQTDIFRTWLVECVNGESTFEWCVPSDHGPDEKKWIDYPKQVLSTHKAGGKWIEPRHGQDHMFDIEAMQLVLARYGGIIQ
jgi:hypothetical protein